MAVGLLAMGAALAQYTVPKSWTRTGEESVHSATLIYDASTNATAHTLRFRFNRVGIPDLLVKEYTKKQLDLLPNMVTNTINGAVTTNVFKTRLSRFADSADVVMAFNWALGDGREAAMIPADPPPPNP